jgi:hypothetical protein
MNIEDMPLAPGAIVRKVLPEGFPPQDEDLMRQIRDDIMAETDTEHPPTDEELQVLAAMSDCSFWGNVQHETIAFWQQHPDDRFEYMHGLAKEHMDDHMLMLEDLKRPEPTMHPNAVYKK